MGMFGKGEAAGIICAQGIPMTRRHGKPSLRIKRKK